MPHCWRCGAPLNIDASSKVPWKGQVKEDPSSSWLRADEFGCLNDSPDSRDQLAREMQDFKDRKREGSELLQEMRRQSGSEPSGLNVVEEESGEDEHHKDSQEARVTLRMTRVSPGGEASERDTRMRQRVRYMDDTGTFIEPRVYDPVYSDRMSDKHYTYSSGVSNPLPSRLARRQKMLRALLVLLILAALGAGGYFRWYYFPSRQSEVNLDPGISLSATMMDDLAAHTILIPGEDGTQIYIRELHASYVVSGGFATVQVPDHTWYDNYDGTLEETMDVTLTPFLKTGSGRQTPLPTITYQIFIPLSPIRLASPDALRTTVATTMSTIQIVVRPGSRVTVNGNDCSDTVSSETGEMSYNATVQPIGDNVFTIVVRSQYCRENSIQVTLYREPQEIPLDLAVGTYGTTYERIMKVSATTLPGAYVEVDSPYSDLDITNLDTTGKFTFNAIFDHVGDNTISITASYPGKKPSVVEHTVYYVPPASEYTIKAWPLSADGYADLLSNISLRVTQGQVYVVTGTVQYSVSEKPQMVVINTSEDGKSQPVLVQNYSKTTWNVGQYYRLYADAFSTYNGMPWLNARYTYTK